MRLKVRQVYGAYIGAHYEVIGPLGQRVWPPPEHSRTYRRPDGLEVQLGCTYDEADSFVAGYTFAQKENQRKKVDATTSSRASDTPMLADTPNPNDHSRMNCCHSSGSAG